MRKLSGLFWMSVLIILSAHTIADSKLAETKSSSPAMNNQRLDELIKRVDDKVKGKPGYWKFTVEGQTIHFMTDENADRKSVTLSC